MCLHIAPPGDGLRYYLPFSVLLFQKAHKRRFARRCKQKVAKFKLRRLNVTGNALHWLTQPSSGAFNDERRNNGKLNECSWRQDVAAIIFHYINTKLTPSASSPDAVTCYICELHRQTMLACVSWHSFQKLAIGRENAREYIPMFPSIDIRLILFSMESFIETSSESEHGLLVMKGISPANKYVQFGKQGGGCCSC